MSKVTNGEFFKSLSVEEQQNFREQYGRHPLREFIDWQEFYNSSNGNELDFIKNPLGRFFMVIDKDMPESEWESEEVIVLLEYEEEGYDYQLVYAVADGIFYKIPKDTPVELIPEELGGEPDDDLILPDDGDDIIVNPDNESGAE